MKAPLSLLALLLLSKRAFAQAEPSAEDRELALYLELLENYELLEDWELLELLPVLEESDED